jgi:hypothetical protein
MGRLLDFGNTLSEYNRSFTGELADMAALRADALALGADFGNALAESQRVKQIAKQKQ